MILRHTLPFAGAFLLVSACGAQTGQRVEVGAAQGQVGVALDSAKGVYEIQDAELGWRLSGELGSAAERVAVRKGRDSIGGYAEIGFDWNPGVPMHGQIRRYEDVPVVWFRARYGRTAPGSGIVFPNLTSFPSGLNGFSYQDRTFSPPTYGLAKTATPWLLFDGQAHSIVVSPASGFMTATMVGDRKSQIGVGIDGRVKQTPGGYEQDSVLVFANGIGAAWDQWGSAVQKLFKKRVPANDSDALLKYFGYWTDNGADYYYNYDPGKGYAETLLALEQQYRKDGIPLGYLQLDSWWYQKSTYDPAGRRGGAKKNNKLPIGSWNRYGGLMEYRAHPDLFPRGLADFQQALGLPLAVHNRWIDRNSPYHDQYRISGVGAIDPNWWLDTVGYLKRCGVVCYEQDWLDEIYLNSPEMASTVGVGDAFTDSMANACNRSNLSMQYCMATPRFFLQGLKYPNLTTIRTSGDRFEPGKWANFIYVSRLAQDAGIWPWCDVFKSGELGNMIISVLSAGPVGTGDAVGKESKENILKAVLPDGVIVKPDRPLEFTDQTYLDGAAKRPAPFVATTFTDHNGLKTTYVFAFPRSRGERTARFSLRSLGIGKTAYVYDILRNRGEFHDPDDGLEAQIGNEGYAYLMVAPKTASGIVFLGDLNKIVPTGRQRIASIEETKAGLKVTVAFAKGERAVMVQGIAPRQPTPVPSTGFTDVESFDPASHRFEILVRPGVHNLASFVLPA